VADHVACSADLQVKLDADVKLVAGIGGQEGGFRGLERMNGQSTGHGVHSFDLDFDYKSK
jgi:hypothetical protein